MPLNKIQYTDNVTVIPASNLNDIQDAIIDLEEDSGSSVPTNVRQAIFTLLESSAYAETGLTDEIAIVESWASEVTEISLSASTLTLNGDTPQTLVATTVPTGSAVVWSTSDSTIATVVGGVVTGVSNGSCVITASAGTKSATCSVTVTGFVELTSISAVYTQSGYVYPNTSLDDLKDDLVITGTYDDSSTETITDYTLSGTLEIGTSTITATYHGKSTTFNVTVTRGFLYVPSDGLLSAQSYVSLANNNLQINESISNGTLNLGYTYDSTSNSATYEFDMFDNIANIDGLELELEIKVLDIGNYKATNSTSVGLFNFSRYASYNGGDTPQTAIGFARYGSNSADMKLRYQDGSDSSANWGDVVSLNTWHTVTLSVANSKQTITIDETQVVSNVDIRTPAETPTGYVVRIGLYGSNTVSLQTQIRRIEARIA